jgi:hypothetical protein
MEELIMIGKILSVVLLSLVILSGSPTCNYTPSPDPTQPQTGSQTTLTHPPVGIYASVTPPVQPDHSSIIVYQNTYAYTDNTRSFPWYDVNQLSISPSPYQNLSYGTVLAIFDLQPSGLVFTQPAGSLLPLLSYDLPLYDKAFDPKYAETHTYVYQIWQLPQNQFVANAQLIKIPNNNTGYWYAQASLPHFSQFALVKFPAPRNFTSDSQGTLGVGTVFMTDGKDILVVFDRVPEKQFGLSVTVGQSRLFRFVGVDPSSMKVNNVPSGSNDLSKMAEQLTQMFKIGTELNWVRQTGKILLSQKDIVEFGVSSVQVY